MRVHFVFVGKTGFSDVESAINRYLDRLKHYCQVQVHVVKAEKISAAVTEEDVRNREGERVRKLWDGRGRLIVLDQRGRELDSIQLSRFVRKELDSGVSEMWMVIGGPVGISPELLKSADSVLALSKMTLPHDLARLMLVEQLYRAFTIIKGEPYHK